MKALGYTYDGIRVVDRESSHFHPEGGLSKNLLWKAISSITIDPNEKITKSIVKFDHNVGFTTCVEVNSNDEIVMVKRIGREGLTPMVKNREMQPCDSVEVILLHLPDRDYATLITAFIGNGSEREPWDRNIKTEEERQRCEDFWSKHALIYNSELIEKES